MHPSILVLAAATAPLPAEEAPKAIVVTGSREPVAFDESGVSATVFEAGALEALALPMTADLLRLVPGSSISTSGARGTQTELRIRGAEANHTLLFVDGIRFNDPAAGNTARFELLTNDSLSRVELVRGPQSALWGSDALGGVVAIETGAGAQRRALSALAEHGSLDSSRASVQGAANAGSLSLSGSAGFLRSDGIDIFSETGERDGFENRAASAKAVVRPLPATEFGLVGHWMEGRSEFDGFDPVTFAFADTLDNVRTRIFAMRGWTRTEFGGWSLLVDGSYLDSANRNRVAETPINKTSGNRLTLGAQLSRDFGDHRFTGAVEHEAEDFRARDEGYFGGTDQDRARRLTAFVGQWRASWSEMLATDVAVRHDDFSQYKAATTVRALVVLKPAAGVALHASYGEGIAQPTFYDLFGFFPRSFVGNPNLRPEGSRGFEAGLRWTNDLASFGVTAFSNRLEDEIVDVFDSKTFLGSTRNVDGRSRRRGFELDGQYRLGGLSIGANYTYLDAQEQRTAGGEAVRETRRPRHSANLFATGSFGAVEIGGSIAYVGKRMDTDFGVFPPRSVQLSDYALASLKLDYRITPTLEAYARVENAFDADYQDAFGYNTPGRTAYAGLRLRLGR
jgi:vitamin B12 transporter